MSRNITLNELPAPFEIKDVRVDEITKWDKDNAYPTRMERIIDSSITAKSSANMLKRFLIGEGFVNPELNNLIIGKDRYGRSRTLYHLLTQVSNSISYHAGFFIRIQYNGNYKAASLRHEHVKNCRFGRLDSSDYAGKVVVYNNWDKENGKYMRQDWSRVDIYNPLESVISSQWKSAGGIDKWKGQMYFWFEDDRYIYPVSPVDPVLYDADTEKQISLFKNGELRRGFFLKYIIHHTAFSNKSDQDDFKEAIKKMMGGGHEYSTMTMEGEFDDAGNLIQGRNINIEPIEQNINSDLFDAYEQSTTNNIRKAFNAIPQILVDYEDSQLGTTSGEALYQASNFYNTQTRDIRKNISQSFEEIFKNWKDSVPLDFSIKELTLGERSDQKQVNLKLQ